MFVKAGTTAPTGRFLRMEARLYDKLAAPFMPSMLAWEDDEASPLLILEDLTDAHWPPPWAPVHIDEALTLLDRVHAVEPELSLPGAEETFAGALALTAEGLPSQMSHRRGWAIVEEDARAFLSLHLCSADWLQGALPELVAAEAGATLTGRSLLHCDVRSDNLCFAGSRALLIDWNWASVGDARFDLAFWLPSLHAEGGPAPHEILRDAPGLAALVSGFFASRAGLAPPPGAPAVRTVQLTQLRSALPWAVHALGLPAIR